MKSVSVILNCFKRPHAISQQIAALETQTVKPKEIFIWVNGSEVSNDFDWENLNRYNTCFSNVNLGVWSRFSLGLNATGDYLCFFDDDTIPGSKWIENCIHQSSIQEGIYGAVGVTFNDLDYISYERHGWPNPNEDAKEVDIVGHSWFFPRKYLGAFWSEAIFPISPLCGEDMNLSYMAQKIFGAKTFVPPHPIDDMSMWGSIPAFGEKYGIDKNAISVNYHSSIFGKSLRHFHSLGFRLLRVK